MNPIIAIVLTMAFVTAAVQLVGTLRGDGYGHNPPPRSHRDEAPLTQHERLRRLAR